MNLRSVLRISTVLLAAATMACEKDDPTSIGPNERFTINTLFAGLDPGETLQLSAKRGGADVPSTYQSSDPAVATVSATGLVTALKPGFAAVQVTETANPANEITSNINVLAPQGVALTNNTPLVVSATGARFSTKIYNIAVPTGRTSLTFTLTGGTGDGDIYVARKIPPTVASNGAVSGAVCASENGGNAETCTISNPAGGVWYVVIALWDPYAGATLKAVYTP